MTPASWFFRIEQERWLICQQHCQKQCRDAHWNRIAIGRRSKWELRTLPISIIIVFSPSFHLQLTFVLQQTLTAATLYLQLTLRVRTAAQQTATRHRRDTQCGLTCPTLSRLTRPTIKKAKRLRYPMQFTASSSSTVGSASSLKFEKKNARHVICCTRMIYHWNLLTLLMTTR